MIKIADRYVDILNDLFKEQVYFNDRYKYYNYSNYYSDINLNSSTWNNYNFVSIDNYRNIIGFISYDINRVTNNVTNLSIIKFSLDSNYYSDIETTMIFANDLKQILEDIFTKFKFNKLCFDVIIGNPAELHYDRLVKRYGGRIVGIKKNDVKLYDNNYYDVKLYEILRDDYIKNRYKVK